MGSHAFPEYDAPKAASQSGPNPWVERLLVCGLVAATWAQAALGVWLWIV